MKDAPKQADIIFIPDSSKAVISETASYIYRKEVAKILLPSGKYSSKLTCFPNEKLGECYYSGVYETDWHFCSEALKENGVPETALLKENRATDTYKNTFDSREITDLKNLNIEKAIICCQAFHARRTLMPYS